MRSNDAHVVVAGTVRRPPTDQADVGVCPPQDPAAPRNRPVLLHSILRPGTICHEMVRMRLTILFLGVLVALFSSCASTSIDDYNYGYAPAYRTLPDGFEEAEIGGTTYWHHGGRFYQHDPQRGYLLVKPPRGHEQVVAATGAAPAPSGSPVAGTQPAATGSGNSLRDIFAPGGGSIKKRGRPRTIGRSPIRQGQVIRE